MLGISGTELNILLSSAPDSCAGLRGSIDIAWAMFDLT